MTAPDGGLRGVFWMDEDGNPVPFPAPLPLKRPASAEPEEDGSES